MLHVVHKRLDDAGVELDLTLCRQPGDRNRRAIELGKRASPNAVFIVVADVELIHCRRSPTIIILGQNNDGGQAAVSGPNAGERNVTAWLYFNFALS
jgi:hypothetical protein